MVINGQENMTTKLVIMNIMLLHPVLDSGAVFNALVGKLMLTWALLRARETLLENVVQRCDLTMLTTSRSNPWFSMLSRTLSL